MSAAHVVRYAAEAEKAATPAWAGSATGFRRWSAVGEGDGAVHTGFGTCELAPGGASGDPRSLLAEPALGEPVPGTFAGNPSQGHSRQPLDLAELTQA